MWGGISLRTGCDRVLGASGVFQILKRGKSKKRVPVTDVEPLRLKLKPDQLNTVVLVRRHTARLLKKNGPVKKLLPCNYVYDVVNNNVHRFPPLNIILKQNVRGIGVAGEMVSLPGDKAYNNFLLPGLAIYASPENIKKYENVFKPAQVEYSSASAVSTVNKLQKMMLGVNMNMDNPWTIEKWHIRVSFRKTGAIVPEKCIELPEKPISGPDPDKQGKHFIVTVTINNFERVHVRCRINHWTNDIDNMLDWQPFWWLEPINPLFPEDADKFSQFPPVRGPYPTEEEKEEFGLDFG